MLKQQQQVDEFHRTFGITRQVSPGIPLDYADRELRVDLIAEELSELEDADYAGDIVGVADALGDLLYVVLGTAVTYGIDLEPIFEEIHRSNMTKVGGRKSATGKLIKPDTYEPPQLEPILRDQGWKPEEERFWDALQESREAV